MFKKILDSITNKEEKDRAQELGEQLKIHADKLQVALESNTSFITLTTLETRYQSVAKELNKLFEKNGITERVQADHKVELEKARKGLDYREKQQVSDSTYKPDDNTASSKDTQYSLGAYPGATPIVSKQKRDVPTFNLEKLQLDPVAGGSLVSSTPAQAKSENLQNTKKSEENAQVKSADNQETENPEKFEPPRQSNFSTSKHCLEYIKQELLKDISPSYVESYLEDQENRTTFIDTIKRGFQLPNIYEIVKNNILRFIAPQEEELANITRDTTPLFTALDIFENLGENEDTEVTMSGSLDMRGLSVKDALDLIPRYNGANIPLTQFLDGCAEAKNILPDGVETDFMKFIRIRLYGEALNIARSQSFANLAQLTEFFEKMFGSAKTYHDFTGELAKVRQRENESVVMYLNKLNEIEKEIRRTARREKRIKNENEFTGELDKDCLKYFMRGLKWEIKACMGTPESYREAQERAIETERELACSLFDRGK